MPSMGDTSVFLYAEHGTSQCGDCFMWVRGDKCIIHGGRRVTADMACGLYVHGTPRPAGTKPVAVLKPSESGLVDRQVRCENCRHFDSGKCGLFAALNSKLPALFKLDTAVAARGCCTAQEPKDEKQQLEERLKEKEI